MDKNRNYLESKSEHNHSLDRGKTYHDTLIDHRECLCERALAAVESDANITV